MDPTQPDHPPTQIVTYPSPPSRPPCHPNCKISFSPLLISLGFQTLQFATTIFHLITHSPTHSLVCSTHDSCSISGMDSRESSSSSEDASLSLAKEASLLFHSANFVDCLKVLHQLSQTKQSDPKVISLHTHTHSLYV